jgi:hypothetical protein
MSVCEHLALLEEAIISNGIKETYRGAAWSKNCREWVYFECTLNTDSLKEKFTFPSCVEVHEHRGTHDGSEKGFVCNTCHDGVMGYHPLDNKGKEFK